MKKFLFSLLIVLAMLGCAPQFMAEVNNFGETVLVTVTTPQPMWNVTLTVTGVSVIVDAYPNCVNTLDGSACTLGTTLAQDIQTYSFKPTDGSPIFCRISGLTVKDDITSYRTVGCQ